MVRAEAERDTRADGPAEVDSLVGSLQILHETAARLKGSPYPQLAVELAMVKIARLGKPG